MGSSTRTPIRASCVRVALVRGLPLAGLVSIPEDGRPVERVVVWEGRTHSDASGAPRVVATVVIRAAYLLDSLQDKRRRPNQYQIAPING